ncbi:MAG: TetR/AcrR family transcriptional regulator [Sphingomonadales bacterium]|nr:TetR/AcrR family transcriptional regulator [Sphingomonadales bacterium]
MSRSPSPPAEAARVDRAATRERIVAAAVALYEEKGLAGLSMRAIASRAGIPTMTLYGHFPSKTAIVRSLWSFAFDPLFAQMRKVEDQAGDPAHRLRSVARTYVAYWMAHPDRYRMVFMVEDQREPGDPAWFIDETGVVDSYMRFGPLIAAARGTPGHDCKAEAEALIGALTGIVHMAITVSEYPWLPPERYADIIVEGLIG